jgi:DNA modification methylase
MNPKLPIIEKLEWGKFVSPLSDRNICPYNWYSFKHRFGSELVEKIFNFFSLKKGDVVFDPFCGGGTTLIKAKTDGYNAFGLDISPFAIFLTNSLTTFYCPNKLRKILKEIPHKLDCKVMIPDVDILKKAFSNSALQYVFSLKKSIEMLDYPERSFFLLCLLTILNSVSRAKKSGGFLRITEQRKTSLFSIKKAFLETAERFIQDAEKMKFNGNLVKASVGDARRYPAWLKNRKFDAILTSPPYPNRHDYTRIYELELLVGFITNNQALKELRYVTLRSHVEAKKRYGAKEYQHLPHLSSLIEKLKERPLNNNRIIPTLEGYFEDMYLALREMTSVIKKGGKIGLVVSNVRFAGVGIPVDELLARIGEQVGLKIRNIYVLRYRGNSSQQMRKYQREPMRESLIVWQK